MNYHLTMDSSKKACDFASLPKHMTDASVISTKDISELKNVTQDSIIYM